MRVLIAEDESLVAFTLRGQLEQRNCEVVGVATTGKEAVEMCKEKRPDVVLMDIRMHGEDGLEATKQIMSEIPTCVVMLTASGRAPDIDKAEEAGAMAYIVKPVSGDQIFPAMEVALKRFEEFKALRREIVDLQETLTTRKLVEKARGILMEKAKLTEAEAFKRLQKMAMDKRLPLRAVAEKVVAAAETYKELFQTE